MKVTWAFCFCLLVCTAHALEIDDYFDQVDNALTVAAFQNNVRARISGTIDIEYYNFQQPAPGLIISKIDNLFNPRLTLFLDAQMGSHIYFFAQSRLDRRFDPSDHGAQVRLDECALRITPWEDGRLSLQVGKFATVVGNWVPRHLSWENPFINAPLVYENVTPIADKFAPASPTDFVRGFVYDPEDWNPVIWGPSYASGVSVSGRLGQFDYAAAMRTRSPTILKQNISLHRSCLAHSAGTSNSLGPSAMAGEAASAGARILGVLTLQLATVLPHMSS